MKIVILNEYLKTPRNGSFYIIAIDGRGAAGKSSLLNYLQSLLPEFTFLNFDNYFEPKKSSTEWGFLNKERFRNDVIIPLQLKNTLTYRPYDWHSEPHIKERSLTIKEGLCIEGLYSSDFELGWDLKFWVETPKEICLERGIQGDQAGMGYERALKTWRDVWQPQEDKYIARIKPTAPEYLIIDGTKSFEEQIIK